jgi:hypothetical protein
VAKMGYRWRVGMRLMSDFGKMFGLKILALLFNTGSYIVLLMNKIKLLQSFGMAMILCALLEDV